jgi:hypothetical protein
MAEHNNVLTTVDASIIRMFALISSTYKSRFLWRRYITLLRCFFYLLASTKITSSETSIKSGKKQGELQWRKSEKSKNIFLVISDFFPFFDSVRSIVVVLGLFSCFSTDKYALIGPAVFYEHFVM